MKPRFFDTPNDQDKLALTTNYLCNEWLDASDLRLFENLKKTSPKRYAVEGLAEWGRSEGLIFDNVETRDFDWQLALKLPGAKAIYGLDFGFTDPTAFVGAIVCPVDKVIFIFLEWYQHGATNEQIAKGLKNLGLHYEAVYCDAAEPKSIAELKKLGINAKEAPKGPDSVRYGIQLLQGYKIIIHPSCANADIEFNNYAWALDRNGQPTDKPAHDYSHTVDACRYACMAHLKKPPLRFNGQ